MKVYKVTGSSPAGIKMIQIVSAKADLPAAKNTLNVLAGVEKKAVVVTEVDLPETKKATIEFINKLLIETI